MSRKGKNALVVMVRVPLEGIVKTRLFPPLSAKEACLLYEAFLQDTFTRLAELKNIDIHVFYAALNNSDPSVDNSSQTLTTISKLYPLTPQKDGDLGDKMKGVFADLFALDYERVVIIGSDSPDIPLAYITRAFTTLKGSCDDDASRLVLGPAIDGGYYLIAMSVASVSFLPSLFTGISWSTSSVLRETLDTAKDLGMLVAMLPEWHDIDIFSDLTYIRDSQELPATMAVINSFQY
jgi:hypothetical protein